MSVRWPFCLSVHQAVKKSLFCIRITGLKILKCQTRKNVRKWSRDKKIFLASYAFNCRVFSEQLHVSNVVINVHLLFCSTFLFPSSAPFCMLRIFFFLYQTTLLTRFQWLPLDLIPFVLQSGGRGKERKKVVRYARVNRKMGNNVVTFWARRIIAISCKVSLFTRKKVFRISLFLRGKKSFLSAKGEKRSIFFSLLLHTSFAEHRERVTSHSKSRPRLRVRPKIKTRPYKKKRSRFPPFSWEGVEHVSFPQTTRAEYSKESRIMSTALRMLSNAFSNVSIMMREIFFLFHRSGAAGSFVKSHSRALLKRKRKGKCILVKSSPNSLVIPC